MQDRALPPNLSGEEVRIIQSRPFVDSIILNFALRILNLIKSGCRQGADSRDITGGLKAGPVRI
jgi:hypothetical protein